MTKKNTSSKFRLLLTGQLVKSKVQEVSEMNVKANKTKKQANVENQAVNLLSKEELCERIEGVEKELKSYTWRELETNGKFAKNDKLSFITDDMLIVGCDIGSETHYIRAIDIRGKELSRKAFEFSNYKVGNEYVEIYRVINRYQDITRIFD